MAMGVSELVSLVVQQSGTSSATPEDAFPDEPTRKCSAVGSDDTRAAALSSFFANAQKNKNN